MTGRSPPIWGVLGWQMRCCAGRRRELVDETRKVWQVSIRRACGVLGAARSSYHYASRRPSQAVLGKRIREIAETQVRYGYRRIHMLLRREGWQVNAKRI